MRRCEMDKKYVSRAINLPEHAANALDKAKLLLEQEIGLQYLSYSQAIQILAVQYVNRREAK
jgi:hypothetical protein